MKPYEISNIVANYQLGTGINIAVLARHLQLTETLTSVKMPGVIERSLKGEQIISEYDEIADSTKYKFSNQCTVTVRTSRSESEVNIKVFNNGNLVLTGFREIETAEEALDILFRSLETLQQKQHPLNYRADCIRLLEPLLSGDASRTQFLRVRRKYLKNRAVLDRLVDFYNMDPDPSGSNPTDELLNILKMEQVSRTEPIELVKFLQNRQICEWLKAEELITLYQVPFSEVSVFRDLFDKSRKTVSEKLFPLALALKKIGQLSIQNINSSFQTGLSLDLEYIKNAINRYSKTLGMRADYKPTGYSAVNIKLDSGVTILLFKEGRGIINGACSLEQVDTAYERLKKFLSTQHQTLKVEDNSIPQELLPDLLIDKREPNRTLFLKKSLIYAKCDYVG